MPWYDYVSGDPSLPANYLYRGPSLPALACPGGSVVCSIYAAYSPSNTPRPQEISPALYADIIAATFNSEQRGNVYVKS